MGLDPQDGIFKTASSRRLLLVGQERQPGALLRQQPGGYRGDRPRGDPPAAGLAGGRRHALREHLALDRIEIADAPSDGDAIRVSFELRITVLHGRALCASFHGPFDVFADGPRRALTEALAARHAAAGDAIRSLLPRLLAADLPPSYVADVAFTRDGAPVLLELNPLYAAGYNVPAAHALVVAALAAELACRAGYPMLSWAEILQTAGALAGEPVEQSPAVWLLR